MPVLALLIALGIAVILLGGCAQKMASEGRYKPLEADKFFDDVRSARKVVSGTLPIDSVPPGDPLATGQENGQFVTTIPMTVTDAVLLRGRERLNIYCAPCHGGGLTGNGPVVQKGFPPPPSLLTPAFAELPVGNLYGIVTHGIGVMPSYAAQIPIADRWAIVAALRSFQQQVQPKPKPTAGP